jgi:hypothetical protein
MMKLVLRINIILVVPIEFLHYCPLHFKGGEEAANVLLLNITTFGVLIMGMNILTEVELRLVLQHGWFRKVLK